MLTNTLFRTDLTPLFPHENFFRIDFFGLVELELLLLLPSRGGGLVEVEVLLPSRGGGREVEVG
jgi:hypothetical protein